MAGIIIGITVMAIVMTAAMPVWRHAAQREKEEELVFRGEQYVHAIGLFQRKYANAFPPSIDLLVEQKFLRKKYKDPITGDDFAPLTQASQQGGVQPGGGQRSGGQAATPAGRGAQPTGRGPTSPATPAAQAPAGGGPAGGIVGVTSKSTDTSIRLYKGRSHYNEWAFVYTAPVQAPGSALPGQRGQQPGRQGQPPQGNFPPGQQQNPIGRPVNTPNPGGPPNPGRPGQPPIFNGMPNPGSRR